MRAGFRLIPESGASTMMKVATSAAAHSPVNRLRPGRFETIRMTVIRISVMRASAANATPRPPGPGAVAA